jgi:Na+/melibiose symporter-like transporter
LPASLIALYGGHRHAAAVITLLPMADWFGGEDKAKGYQMAMTVLALIGMCMFLFCFATVRERPSCRPDQ